MKLRAPDSGNGDGGGSAGVPDAKPAETTTTMMGGADQKPPAPAETKPAAGVETKPAETKDTKPAETKPEDKKPALVDDKWEPKAADGVKRDPKAFGDARSLFKKLGLNTEQSQALVEFADARAKAEAEAHTAADAAWVKEITEDKEIGGAKLPATRTAVREMLRQLKTGPALSKWLDDMGIGNAAPLMRTFAELASRVGEDNVRTTVTDPAASAHNEHERRAAKTYGNSHRKES